MPTLRNGLLCLAIATALCACGINNSGQAEMDDPITMKKILRDANVRDASVLWTEPTLRGAATSQEEWADYLYDAHHTGVAVYKTSASFDDSETSKAKEKNDKKNSSSDSANKSASDEKTVEDQSVYSKDRSIYAKDRSIYSKNQSRSIKKKAKTKKQRKPLSIQKKKPEYETVKTQTIGGKKVSETIVELKDPPKAK